MAQLLRHPSIGCEARFPAFSEPAAEQACKRLMAGRLRDADYVAERLGVPRSWVYRAARHGELPSVRCGRYRRFDERDIERWIEGQRLAGDASREMKGALHDRHIAR